jgi:hypothetical protein
MSKSKAIEVMQSQIERQQQDDLTMIEEENEVAAGPDYGFRFDRNQYPFADAPDETRHATVGRERCISNSITITMRC